MSEQKPKINSLEIVSHAEIIPTKLTFSDRFNVILGNGEAEESRFIKIINDLCRMSINARSDLEGGLRELHIHNQFFEEMIVSVTNWDKGSDIFTSMRLGHGLYHANIRRIMREELDDIQSFVYTQSATVLDHLYFESAEEVQRSLILAESVEQEDGSMRPYWRDPTEEEAEGFYQSYQVGIMHVSEILRLRGMW